MITSGFLALTDTQLERLQNAAWDFLEAHGFTVSHPRLLQIARATGAHVDEASGRIRVPVPLARELMTGVPGGYRIRTVVGETWEVGGEA